MVREQLFFLCLLEFFCFALFLVFGFHLDFVVFLFLQRCVFFHEGNYPICVILATAFGPASPSFGESSQGTRCNRMHVLCSSNRSAPLAFDKRRCPLCMSIPGYDSMSKSLPRYERWVEVIGFAAFVYRTQPALLEGDH
jgi:hypothetical protein